MSMEKSQSQKNRLDDLPSSSDTDFWADADCHIDIRPVSWFKQIHYFIRVAGHQAQCKDCDWGFQLDPGDKIIDGHLFNRKGRKII